jgi:hypothetical protein
MMMTEVSEAIHRNFAALVPSETHSGLVETNIASGLYMIAKALERNAEALERIAGAMENDDA